MRAPPLRLALALLVGCGASDASPFGEPATPPLGENPSSGGLPTTATPPTDDCTEAAKLVYVVSQENDLYRFAPDTLTFTKIGRLSCAAGNDKNGRAHKPVSMAVDRAAVAWVNYTDGKIWKVSTKDASCTDSGYAPNQSGFLRFGMAFATNGANTKEESLFIAGLQDGTAPVGKGLGKIDVTSLELTMIGDFDAPLAAQAAELTGSGEGKLYGFFRTSPAATLAVIDGTSAATAEAKPLAGVDGGNAFAFTFWGGAFYTYTTPGLPPSKVTRVKTTGETEVVMNDVGGFRIVGAGVSTCAPTQPIVR